MFSNRHNILKAGKKYVKSCSLENFEEQGEGDIDVSVFEADTPSDSRLASPESKDIPIKSCNAQLYPELGTSKMWLFLKFYCQPASAQLA